MKIQKFKLITGVLFLLCAISLIDRAIAAGPKVSENGNKHNLSALAWSSGTLGVKTIQNTYQATNDSISNPGGQQVCIFCHTPHNANVAEGAPLWNREFSSQIFSRYSTNTLRIRIDGAAKAASGYDAAWLPDGSSKLCLSCHDGVASLGNVRAGSSIVMLNGKDVITGFASFNPATTNKMKSGHHPVSFKYDSSVAAAINAGKTGYQLPSAATPAALASAIKLDKNGKMQCTTCHNAHQNQTDDVANYGSPDFRKIAPFWVYGGANVAVTDHDSVCKACHPISPDPTVAPW